MKNRRDFLKFLGIGAGAAASVVLAVVAGRGGSPVTPPQAIIDLERPKIYDGPDSFPGGDYIRRAPDIIRDINPIPEIDKIAPDISGLTHDEMIVKMVDNVFKPDPFYQYLTTTGTELNVVNNERTFTIDKSNGNSDYIFTSPEMLTWTTAWTEMSSVAGSVA